MDARHPVPPHLLPQVARRRRPGQDGAAIHADNAARRVERAAPAARHELPHEPPRQPEPPPPGDVDDAELLARWDGATADLAEGRRELARRRAEAAAHPPGGDDADILPSVAHLADEARRRRVRREEDVYNAGRAGREPEPAPVAPRRERSRSRPRADSPGPAPRAPRPRVRRDGVRRGAGPGVDDGAEDDADGPLQVAGGWRTDSGGSPSRARARQAPRARCGAPTRSGPACRRRVASVHGAACWQHVDDAGSSR
jgi:hypothetical protein